MMNQTPEKTLPPLGALLKGLKSQVLATRDNPAPAGPGQVLVADVYDAAEEARQSVSFRP